MTGDGRNIDDVVGDTVRGGLVVLPPRTEHIHVQGVVLVFDLYEYEDRGGCIFE